MDPYGIVYPRRRRATLAAGHRYLRNLLGTLQEPAVWRDRLKQAGDPNDEHFVARLRQSWANWNTDNDFAAWLKDSRGRW